MLWHSFVVHCVNHHNAETRYRSIQSINTFTCWSLRRQTIAHTHRRRAGGLSFCTKWSKGSSRIAPHNTQLLQFKRLRKLGDLSGRAARFKQVLELFCCCLAKPKYWKTTFSESAQSGRQDRTKPGGVTLVCVHRSLPLLSAHTAEFHLHVLIQSGSRERAVYCEKSSRSGNALYTFVCGYRNIPAGIL